ncbi:CsbD family protein [Litorimonas haliclonae]|uniref:CsbD family protein n=1 Tax=Litorimonas haliclonae TaxID=2081977 RepID=UPI0039EFAC34
MTDEFDDHEKAKANRQDGKIKEKIGDATDDPSMKAKGKLQKAKGDLQEIIGDAKDALKVDVSS